MTVVVGLAVLARRGWRPAALQTVPLAGVYSDLVRSHRPRGLPVHGAPLTRRPRIRVRSAQRDRVPHARPAPGLGVVLVDRAGRRAGPAGPSHTRWSSLRRWAAAPLALLVGSVVFATLAAFGRAARSEHSSGSRPPLSPVALRVRPRRADPARAWPSRCRRSSSSRRVGRDPRRAVPGADPGQRQDDRRAQERRVRPSVRGDRAGTSSPSRRCR